MTKAIKMFAAVLAACLLQTEAAQYLRVFDIAPDFLILFLVLFTDSTGTFGGFCAGALMAMFYDASVGYVLAINLVAYTALGYAAPLLRTQLNDRFRKFRHKQIPELMSIAFFLTLLREILYIGYLFLIGAQQGSVTLIRMLIACIYNALLIIPMAGLKDLWQLRRRGNQGIKEEHA